MRQLDSIFQWLYDSPLAEAMRESAVLFPWVEAIHVLALSLVVGSIAVFDLRLLGVASKKRSVRDVIADVMPVTWVAFVVAAVTGVLLFSSNALAYAHNGPFQWKVLLLVLLGVNAAVFHSFVGRHIEHWQHDEQTPWQARLAGFTSVSLWIGVTVFGRWIGFTINALP
ncbi:MAG: hypothetical protein JWN48_2546 [Myxococcaceae bacterium]|nr:hypothetical protein [Myxococcaceae bacterium]